LKVLKLNMNCQKVQESLWEYHRSQLAANLMLEIKEHIKTCLSCAAQFDTLRQVDFELDRLPELNPSSIFDQKLNAKLDELGKDWSGLGIRAFWREHRYALSFILLFIVTVSAWIGFRRQQEQRLGTLEDVLELQEKYLGKLEPSTGQTDHSVSAGQEPLPRTHPDGEVENPSAQDQAIPDEDRAVIENFDLLEDYDFLRKFDFADMQMKPQ
jgi:hypothetical protein